MSARRTLAGSAPDALWVLALAALPLLAAVAGASGPVSLGLNLGPGDGPYVTGFLPRYEVEDKLGTHWTSYDAAVAWPLRTGGAALDLSYRFARVFPETAAVEVLFQGRAVDHFTCRGGVFQERHVAVTPDRNAPLTVAFKVDSHERRNQGLKLDWVRVQGEAGARWRLTGGARLRGALLVALAFLLLRYAAWGRAAAALLTAPLALGLAFGLLRDPWLVHRLLTGIPETLALAGLPGVGLGRWLLARTRIDATDLRGVALLAVGAFLLRACALNHPDFYYPDLMTHARLVGVLKSAGLDFFLTPAHYLDAQGAWTKPAYGASAILPYAVGFHALLAPWALDYDTLLTVMKLTGALLSTLPLVFVWGIARRLGLAPLGALLMLVVPTYTSRLTFALLPALTGHAMDMALVFWLAANLERIGSLRVWLAGAGLVAASQLSYVSSVTNVSLLIGALALLAPWDAADDRVRRGLRILGMGLAGSLLAVLLYYRDFLGSASGLLGHGAQGASRYPVESFFALSYERTRDFFGAVYPGLALAGLALTWRRSGRGLLLAWLASYFLLLLLRAKLPDVFRYGHETLWVTPLVCLASGEALSRLAAGGPLRRGLAAALLAFLAFQGLQGQRDALTEQLGNAL